MGSRGELWRDQQVNKCFRAAGLAVCFAAVLAVSGAQWMALQSYAWVRMTLAFSQQDSLGRALSKALSGRYPCALCLKVENGMQQEQEQEKKAPSLNTEKMPEIVWELRCLTAPPIPTHPIDDVSFGISFCFEFSDSPPTPPPRA